MFCGCGYFYASTVAQTRKRLHGRRRKTLKASPVPPSSRSPLSVPLSPNFFLYFSLFFYYNNGTSKGLGYFTLAAFHDSPSSTIPPFASTPALCLPSTFAIERRPRRHFLAVVTRTFLQNLRPGRSPLFPKRAFFCHRSSLGFDFLARFSFSRVNSVRVR